MPVKVALEVSGSVEDAHELRQWLRGEPEVRQAVLPLVPASPAPGSMGSSATVIELLLQPGGLTVTLAAGVVAWLQTRRGGQTVTISRPDGTEIVVASQSVRGLTPESSGKLALEVARALDESSRRDREAGTSEP
ncbi:effector-associated constant component EACC1 [Streptomyces koyangensis]